MFGLFTLNKNNINNLIFLFKNDNNTSFSTQIIDWGKINNFNENVLKECQNYIEKHYDKPYKTYYYNCKDSRTLASLCQQLRIDLGNPAIKLDQISIDLLNYK